MKTKTTFGQRLRQRRDAADLTQRELAIAANVTIQTVSNLENGRGNPSLSILRAFAGVLDCTVGDLAGENNS